jgi:hypothetical protein
MLASLDRTKVVVFDRIDENAVFANSANFNDVVGELGPF